MDPRTAAHTLARIAALLELRGEDRFRVRAYEVAARAVRALPPGDLAPLVRSDALADLPGLGPATLGVLRDLVEQGRSPLLARLAADTPESLVTLLAVPGLGVRKLHLVHERLGVASLDALEAAGRDGRLAALPGFGPKTVAKVLDGVAFVRAGQGRRRWPDGAAEAGRLVAEVRAHPAVERAEAAGDVRRRSETVGTVDVVAAVAGEPAAVAAALARLPGARCTAGTNRVQLAWIDGTRLDLWCVPPERFAVALWQATGSAAHVAAVGERLAARGLAVVGDAVHDARGAAVPVPDEPALYALAGLAYVEPELREARGEVEAAAAGALPTLVTTGDLQGVLHCHSTWSDGTATVAEMADAARARGWRYLGLSDHSQAASYAGGLTPDAVRRQHDEIAALNAAWAAAGDPFRVLRGIEADILADGALDYDDATLDRFDYVIGSVHSRFDLDEARMTARLCRALDDPRLTVLGHPTGRLLLSRAPYAVDMPAVLEKAAEVGAAVELNADPHRLDLSWTLCREARARGIPVAIGPDAHAPAGLDHVAVGVGIARKGWLGADDVLNTRPADAVLAFARRRREGAHAR